MSLVNATDVNQKTSVSTIVVVILVLTYIFLFEWRLFKVDSSAVIEYHIEVYINIFKFMIPSLLFLIALSRSTRFSEVPLLTTYTLLFAIFLIWGFFPSVFSKFSSECVGQWAKFVSRFIFFIGLVHYFVHEKRSMLLLAKGLIWIAVFTVLQYLCLISTNYNPSGPYQTNFMWKSDTFPWFGYDLFVAHISMIDVDLRRLVGWWYEPSTASAYLFAMFFLSRAIWYHTLKIKYKYISYLCCLGGFCCLSNAGYLSFGAAILLHLVLKKKKMNLVKKLIVVVIAMFFSLAGLFGKSFVISHHIDTEVTRIVFGIRSINVHDSNKNYDPTAGRVKLAQKSIELALNRPFGIGIQIPGARDDTKDRHDHVVSASAPFQWLAFTGFPGLIILLIMHFVILFLVYKNKKLELFQINIAQAWIVLFTQNLSYGTWFSPLYFVCVGFVFCSFHRQFNQLHVLLLAKSKLFENKRTLFI